AKSPTPVADVRGAGRGGAGGGRAVLFRQGRDPARGPGSAVPGRGHRGRVRSAEGTVRPGGFVAVRPGAEAVRARARPHRGSGASGVSGQGWDRGGEGKEREERRRGGLTSSFVSTGR